MTDPTSRDFRYRLFAGVFLVVLLAAIGIILLLWRYTPAALAGIVPLSLLLAICLIRAFSRRGRRQDQPHTVGALSRDELRVARSKLKPTK